MLIFLDVVGPANAVDPKTKPRVNPIKVNPKLKHKVISGFK